MVSVRHRSTFANPGEITGILGLNQNFIGGLEVEGYDFAVNYRLKTDNWGNFKFNWGNAYISYYGDVGQPKRGQVNGDGDISLGNTIGQETTIGSFTGATQFRLRSQLNTAWDLGNWSLSGSVEYMSKVAETCSTATNTANQLAARGLTGYVNLCTNPNRVADSYIYKSGTSQVIAVPQSAPRNVMPSVTYVDVQGSWRAPWKAVFSAGVRNLFDRQPPFCSDCFANSYDSQYRIPGRFYYMSYQQNFDF